MADICCDVSEDGSCDTSSRAARRRRMDLRRVRTSSDDGILKRRRLEVRDGTDYETKLISMRPENGRRDDDLLNNNPILTTTTPLTSTWRYSLSDDMLPKFGIASVCGRRRDMEDAVAIHPSFCQSSSDQNCHEPAEALHYFGVYDGHGCSHVATKCRERLHDVVKEELHSEVAEESNNNNNDDDDDRWKNVMEKSFSRMDKEVIAWNENVMDNMSVNCRCELQSPECDAVGSTAVVAVVSLEKIVVANCGDSRAVLCRNGRAVPLSTDHKPDRPDELNRIQAAGGRVIYWEGARVLGVLAMSRAIGDNYLKPYVSCEPEVSITQRTDDDECLILASDGLWDVVSNDTACGVARMCLKGMARPQPSSSESSSYSDDGSSEMSSDQACNDASMLLTKLALARRSADNVSVVVVDLRRTPT